MYFQIRIPVAPDRADETYSQQSKREGACADCILVINFYVRFSAALLVDRLTHLRLHNPVMLAPY